MIDDKVFSTVWRKEILFFLIQNSYHCLNQSYIIFTRIKFSHVLEICHKILKFEISNLAAKNQITKSFKKNSFNKKNQKQINSRKINIKKTTTQKSWSSPNASASLAASSMAPISTHNSDQCLIL